MPPSTQPAFVRLGKKIALARRVRGISAEQFAKSAEISCDTLKRLESGNGGEDISLNTLAMVLSVLGRLDLPRNLVDMHGVEVEQSTKSHSLRSMKRKGEGATL